MGAAYSVTLKIKMRKVTKGGAANLLRVWMKERENPKKNGGLGVNWCLKESSKAGIRPTSFSGVCKILLAFHQGDGRHSVEDGFDVFRSAFNATYSWGPLVEEAFKKIAWALEEGSMLEYWSDNDHAVFKVEINDKGDAEVWERFGR